MCKKYIGTNHPIRQAQFSKNLALISNSYL